MANKNKIRYISHKNILSWETESFATVQTMYFIFEERIIRKEVESFFNKVAYPGESAGSRPFVINGFFWKLMRWFIAILNDFENNIDRFLGNPR